MNAFESDGDLARIYGKLNASAPERTYANSFSYTPDGRIEKLKLGNYRWEWAKFNERLQVTELNLGSGVADASLWKLKYEYGEINSNGDVETSKNTGNIARLTTSFNGLATPFVQTFKYDSLYRLVEAKEVSGTNENWKELFSYDRYGNRTDYEKYFNTVQQSLDNKTHPSINPQTNRFNTGQGYSYDLNGNLVGDAEGRNFTFNGDNKQSVIKNGTTLLAQYFYDGEGKRIKKKVYEANGVTVKEETVFVYDGLGKLIAEYSTATPPQNPTTNYTATDMLESPRVITDSQGNVVSRRDFMPFGEELANDPNYRTAALKYNTGDEIRQKFTGYQKDEETNLDFAEARMYENRHARFTAVDPLLASGKSANPQSFNRYVYVRNNPLIFTDPSGMQTAKTAKVYYKVVNGQWAFSNLPGNGYNDEFRFKNPKRVIGQDGYYYTVTRSGWTRGRKAAAAQQFFGNSEGATKAKTTGYVNNELVNSLAEHGQRKFNVAAGVIFGLGPAIGACIALCPAAATGLAAVGSTPITLGKGAVATGITLYSASDGCGSGLGSGESGGGGSSPCGGGITLFTNQMPDRLSDELDQAAKLGVSPLRVGDAGFDNAVNQGDGVVKWAVTENGQLVFVPKFVGNTEISHSVLTAGGSVQAAGEARIAGSPGNYFLIHMDNHSGHFEPSNESLDIGRRAFEENGIRQFP